MYVAVSIVTQGPNGVHVWIVTKKIHAGVTNKWYFYSKELGCSIKKLKRKAKPMHLNFRNAKNLSKKKIVNAMLTVTSYTYNF